MKATTVISDDGKAVEALEAEIKRVRRKIREYENLEIALNLSVQAILSDVSRVSSIYLGGKNAVPYLYQQ
jgi:hypothetical protein